MKRDKKKFTFTVLSSVEVELSWGKFHPYCNGWPSLTPRKIPCKFHVAIFIRSVSRIGGVLYGGTWRILRVPDWRRGWQGQSWCHEWCSFTLRNISWKFCVNISIRSVSRRGVKKGVTWRTLRVPDRRHGWYGHSWYHEWFSFYPKDHTLKILCQYLN